MTRRRRSWGVAVRAQQSLAGVRGAPGPRVVLGLVLVVGRGGHSGRVGGRAFGVWAEPALPDGVGIVVSGVRMSGQ